MARFRCCGCGSCCRNWNVELDPQARRRIEAALATKPHPEWGTTIPLREGGGDRMLLRLREDGACSFLTEDSKCWLQREFGHATLPFICRTYPRRYIPTPLGFFATLTPSCHTAARTLTEDPRETPIDPEIDIPLPGEMEPFRLEDGIPLSLRKVKKIEREIERILFSSDLPTSHRLCRVSQFLDEIRAPLASEDDLGFSRAIQAFRSASLPFDAPRPVAERISILRSILRQRGSLLIPGESAATFPHLRSLLEEVYALDDETASPPATIRMSRALERHWKPGLPQIDRLLLRFVQREIWSKQHTYGHGYRDGVRIVAFLYFVLRALATARAVREGVPVSEAHVVASAAAVARDFSHSQVVLAFWKGLLRIPHASKPWFVPLLVLT